MLKKDYVLTAILQEFEDGKTITDVHNWLGLDETVLMAIHEVHESGNKWGQALTGIDIVEFYRSGLTFSEVAWVKGVTKEAIRLTVDIVIGAGKAQAKELSKGRRAEMKENILYDMVVLETDRTSREEAILKTGYSEGVFKRVYRESVKWKQSQGEQQTVEPLVERETVGSSQ